MEDHQPHTGLLGCRDWQHSIHIICRHFVFEFSLQYYWEIHMKGDETDDAEHDLPDSGVEISGLSQPASGSSSTKPLLPDERLLKASISLTVQQVRHISLHICRVLNLGMGWAPFGVKTPVSDVDDSLSSISWPCW